ncbi:MAG: helix-turn-helix transcriptional regulator [Myxococcales bacterium]|nr:helix-turn-helix transcriptional regulator [Myxococcales bacterium]
MGEKGGAPTQVELENVFALLTGRTDADGNALRARRELTRARIVSAVSELLLAHGYRHMRVDDVAAAAHVSRPTLYTYFESKERLLIAALSEEAIGQLESVARVFDPKRSAEDRLRDIVRDTILYIVKAPLTARIARDRDPDVLRILLGHELARKALGMNPDLDKARYFSSVIREAFPAAFTKQEAGEIASVLRAISHMAPALLDEHVRFGLSVERIADWVSTLLVDGMRAQSTRKP